LIGHRLCSYLDEKAKRFYQKHDFLSLKDMPLRLYIPMKGLEQKLKLSSTQASGAKEKI